MIWHGKHTTTKKSGCNSLYWTLIFPDLCLTVQYLWMIRRPVMVVVMLMLEMLTLLMGLASI
jgi:hypothetical protein